LPTSERNLVPFACHKLRALSLSSLHPRFSPPSSFWGCYLFVDGFFPPKSSDHPPCDFWIVMSLLPLCFLPRFPFLVFACAIIRVTPRFSSPSPDSFPWVAGQVTVCSASGDPLSRPLAETFAVKPSPSTQFSSSLFFSLRSRSVRGRCMSAEGAQHLIPHLPLPTRKEPVSWFLWCMAVPNKIEWGMHT